MKLFFYELHRFLNMVYHYFSQLLGMNKNNVSEPFIRISHKPKKILSPLTD